LQRSRGAGVDAAANTERLVDEDSRSSSFDFSLRHSITLSIPALWAQPLGPSDPADGTAPDAPRRLTAQEAQRARVRGRASLGTGESFLDPTPQRVALLWREHVHPPVPLREGGLCSPPLP
jgi:hypothetical protein